MYRNKSVAAVIPAFNEEALVGAVLAGLPDCVDRIIVVDDASRDDTAGVVRTAARADARIELIVHDENRGVGAAIVSGYKAALAAGADIAVVLAGDNQMDPAEMPRLLDPLVEDQADYVKGNRLITGEAWKVIPRLRYLGQASLSLLTKIASGYWRIADFQCGYTAISRDCLERLPLDRLYPRFGFPNHLAVMLNIFSRRVKDVPVRPIYNVGEKSKLKIRKVIPRISRLLLRSFFWRLKEKYIIRDFHPLVFFYGFGLFFFPLGLLYGAFIVFVRLFLRHLTSSEALIRLGMTLSTPVAMLMDVIFITTGLQLLLFAMWFDMEDNRDLNR